MTMKQQGQRLLWLLHEVLVSRAAQCVQDKVTYLGKVADECACINVVELVRELKEEVGSLPPSPSSFDLDCEDCIGMAMLLKLLLEEVQRQWTH